MSWEGATAISVVGLQNEMDFVQSEPGCSNESCVPSKHDGNGVICTEEEMMSDISEVANQDTTTIPPTKKVPNVSCVPLVNVTHISCRLYKHLPAPIKVSP